MAQFGRKLNDDGLKALEDALTLPEQGHWWRDLLSLWYPSGQSTGDYGLRLAIRNGYMNFYRRGQSVARVSLQNRKPKLSVHAKYVLAKRERQAVKGQEYVTLTTDSLVRRGEQSALPYKGIETLKAWVRAVDEEYSGPEKRLVDELLGVPQNDCVVDLEMGLPAWREKKTAPRMDLVSIERANNKLTVFFGEVKRVTDGRLRCRAPVKRDKKPEVLEQLSDYRNYLAEPEHAALVGKQYANAARLMKRLRAMADVVGPVRVLGQTILEAATRDHLAVAPLATLVVMNEASANQAAWEIHRAKLESEKERVPMIVLEAPAALRFGDRA